MKYKLTIPIFLLVIGLYLIIIVNSIGKPLVADEWINRSIAESIALTGKLQPFGLTNGIWLDHPPLYYYSVAGFFKLFGIGDLQARFVGVVFCILNFILIFLLSRNLYPKDKFTPIMACLFFGLSPLVIQGSGMTEVDQTVLTFSVILFLYCFIRVDKWPVKRRIPVLALIFFLVICAKFSLPPILLLSMIVYYGLKRQFVRGMLETLSISLIGLELFLIFWWFFCYSLNITDYFLTPFIYILRAFICLQVRGDILQKLISAGTNLFRISLWTSPFLLALGFYVVAKLSKSIIQEKKIPRDFVLSIFVLLVLIGYLFVGGLAYGFPKTYLPMMPALSVLIAGNLTWNINDKRRPVKLGIIFIAVLLFFLVAVGDVIYLVQYSIKEALIYNFRLGFVKFYLPLLLYLVSPFLVLGIISLFFYQCRIIDRFLLSLVITTLAANLSLDVLQAKADYLTTAEYGGRGTVELVYFLRGILRQGDTLLSTGEIIYDVRATKSISPTSMTWSSREGLLALIRQKEPRVIVYGIPLNTIEQFKRIFLTSVFLDFLRERYSREDIGSYTVWIKK